MNHSPSKILCVLTLVAAYAAPAVAQNGVTIFEWPLSTDPNAPNMYVDCIDDGIAMDLLITEKFQAFYTPSGKGHLVSNWTITGTATGQDTGWNWYVHGASPLTIDTQGEQYKEQGVVNAVLEPLDGGPRLKTREHIRLIVNASGEVQIAELKVVWKCLGQG